MRIQLKNLGITDNCDINLNNITVICGENNSGKTYITYAIYGFLMYWKQEYMLPISKKTIKNLLYNGAVVIDIEFYLRYANEIIKNACKKFFKYIPTVFATKDINFMKAVFCAEVDSLKDYYDYGEYHIVVGSKEKELFNIRKEKNSKEIQATLLVQQDKVEIPFFVIKKIVSDALKKIIFSKIVNDPFIVSSERTGISIFRNDLDIIRNKVLDFILRNKNTNSFLSLLNDEDFYYALPIKNNIEFNRSLSNIMNRDSFVSKRYKKILKKFYDIVGGGYAVDKDGSLYFIPRNQKRKLSLGQSSSSVRALVDMYFYVKHVAQKDDILIIDEPELNLHPQNQRRLARFLVALSNIGIKILITTHSDYILKEINTLIQFYVRDQRVRKIAKDEGYNSYEFLNFKKINIYMTQRKDGEKFSLNAANITKHGIEVKTFDEVIDDMNRIQDLILWG